METTTSEKPIRCYLDPFREKIDLPHIRIWSKKGDPGFHPIYKCFNYWAGVEAFGLSPEAAYANYQKLLARNEYRSQLPDLRSLCNKPEHKVFFDELRNLAPNTPLKIPDSLREDLERMLGPGVGEALEKVRRRETIYRSA